MPTITLSSSNTAVAGFNMLFFGVGDISNLVTGYLGSNSTSQLFYGNGISAELYVYGTFGDFNVDGDPTSGTANAFSFTHSVNSVFQSISITGLSLSVPTLFNWIFTNDTISFHNAVFNGADTITGSAGADLLMGYGGNDTINGGDGADEIYGEVHPFTVYNPAGGNDTLNGGNGNDTLNGGAGNDIMNGDEGNDTIISASGVDAINGGNGIDTLTLDRASSSTAYTLNLISFMANGSLADGTTVQNVENLTFSSGSGADTFTINADGSNFTIDAGAGNDRLVVDFSALNNAMVFSDNGLSMLSTNGSVVFSGFEQLTASGGSGNDTIRGFSGDDTINGGAGSDTLNGLGGVDTINGGEGADFIDGGQGSDIINGGGGDDFIFLITGADQIDGGDGSDSIYLDLGSILTGISVSATSFSSPTGVTLSNGAVIRNVENLANSYLTSGDDTFTINGSGLTGYIYSGNGGFDTVIGDFSALTTNVIFVNSGGSWRYTGGTSSDVTFTSFERLIMTGGSGNDSFTGGDGNDTLSGGAGADTLWGDAGTNVLSAGDGDDAIVSDRFATDTIDGGAGIDFLRMDQSSASQAFTVNLAQLASAGGLAFGNGTTARNIERIDFYGGSGNDTFVVNTFLYGTMTLAGGGGTDTLIADFSALSSSVSLNSTTLSTGAGSVNVEADIFTVTGSSVGDTLTGGFYAQTLYGGGGNDALNGGAGAGDILYGGDGDDILYATTDGGDANEIIDGGEGIDMAYISRGGTTANMVIQTAAFATATGVTFADGTVVRSIESIRIGTGSGDDTFLVDSTLTGFNMLFSGGDGFDRMLVDLAGWSGTILMADQYSLSTSAFGLTLLVDRLEITAGSGSDTLYGGFGDDLINGGGGADVLRGGQGIDTINGDAGNDLIMGEDGNDILNGGDGADQLRGGNNNDSMNGGAGVDSAILFASSDESTWSRNTNGSWTVTTTADGVDTVTNLEVLDFLDRDVFLDRPQSNFSTDGVSDFLLRNTSTGGVVMWFNAANTNAASLGTLSTNWINEGAGDFNGDGRDDIVWRDANTGNISMWFMNNQTVTGAAGLGLNSAWSISGIGDLNGDLKDDFVLRSNTGDIVLWFMDGGAVTGASLGNVATQWQIEVLGDFNGDGRDDFIWRNSATGDMSMWLMNGTAVTPNNFANVGGNWNIVGVGDLNGDGRDDVIWRDQTTGNTALWFMNGGTITSQSGLNVATNYSIADIGDYNGDGRDDIIWRNSATNDVLAWYMNGATVQGSAFIGGLGADWVINPGG
ncbi:MAG: FG-GAP-like repeat-containing protein [Terricaulis sp.]